MDPVLECLLCKDLFKEPVFLPCGCTVCKKHVDAKATENAELATIQCPKCQIDHDIPEKGFVVNSMAVSILERSSAQAKREEAEKKTTIESFEYLKDLFDEFKRIQDTPELEIDRVYDELKNKIDLRREEAKMKIDKEALGLIEELEMLYKKLKKALSDPLKVVSSATDKEKMKSIERKISASHLQDLKADCKKWKETQNEILQLCQYLKSEYDRLNQSIFTKDFECFSKKQKIFCVEKNEPIL